ncbi:hypothetical protein [Conexibacter sp. DBS9H8]|uniref:hypothetical protein n=1 Tax=Conexibacter sp. DBS9H8 TaxID=2937801 RepID=UPI00200F94C9|nr:hypothetical protein [Conexibacter sp. DBS9H8]
MDAADSPSDLSLAALCDWVAAGAHWRLLDHHGDRVSLQLCSCLGEPVEAVISTDPALIAYLGAARSDEDLAE